MNLLPVLTGSAAPVARKLFWRYKAKGQRAARDGDYKFLKILDNTFLFNVVEDPLERANLKERQKDVYDRLVAEWLAWNATMLPEIAESFTSSFTGDGARRPLRRCRKQAAHPIQPAFASGPAVAVAVKSWLDPLDPNDFGQADELRPGLGSTVWRYVSFGSIVLQKSKIERRRKSRRSWFIGRLPAILRSAHTKLRGRFRVNDEVPHIAARGTHQRSQKKL